MKQRKLLLSVAFLAGTCMAIAPAWSQTQPSERPSGGRSSDELQPRPSAGQESQAAQGEKGAKQSGGIKSEGQPGGTSAQTGQRQGGMERESRVSGARAEGQGDVKQIQEALKEKGHDPGPIDGIMGQRTREALRSFQQSNNLKATGRMDAETAQQLGVEHQAGAGTGQQRSGEKAGGSSKQGMSGKSEQRSEQSSGKESSTR